MSVGLMGVVRKPGEGLKLQVLGGSMTYKVVGGETGGTLFIAELTIPASQGPPPHIHTREDEAFYVLDGTVKFEVGDQQMVGEPGAFCFGPRQLRHGFRNVGRGPARLLVVVTPAGFERFFEEASRLAPGPQSLLALKMLCDRYGVTLLL